MAEVSDIRKSFLKSKLKDLELGVKFTKAFKDKMNLTLEEFLGEYDSSNKILIRCGKKELDLFRLNLEAYAIDWNNYKLKRLFKSQSFKKGIFLKTTKLPSEDLEPIYKILHKKRIDVEVLQGLRLF